jgi:hypothetical protein
MRLRVFLSLAIIVFSFSRGDSQAFYAIRRDHDVMITFGTGLSSYFGDLNNPSDRIDTEPNIVAGVQISPAPNFIQNRLHTRASLTYFRLEGDDKYADDDRVERNLNFWSNNVQLTAVGLIDLFKNDKKYYKRLALNFYGLTGVGLLYINPKTEYNGEKVALQPLRTEGVKYSRFQFVIPYGLGVKFAKGPLWNISIEAIWHKAFTDYLDDVSVHDYPEPSTLSSDLARALSDRRLERDPKYFKKSKKETHHLVGVRGFPEQDDSYMFLNLKFDYYLPIDLFTQSDKRLMRVKQNRPRTR